MPEILQPVVDLDDYDEGLVGDRTKEFLVSDGLIRVHLGHLEQDGRDVDGHVGLGVLAPRPGGRRPAGVAHAVGSFPAKAADGR